MKNVLFITSASLAQAKRGTPLRMLGVARQIRKRHSLFMVTQAVDPEFADIFVKYPEGSFIQKINFFKKFIKDKKIDIVFANTDIEIVFPIFIKLFTGVKIAVDLHGRYAEEMYTEGLIGPIKRRLIEWVVKFSLLFYDAVFTVSGKLKNYYRFYNKNINILYGGVNDYSRINTYYPPAIFTISYAGNMKAYQGLDYLLKACQNIKAKNLFDFRLILILSSGTTHIEEILKKYNLLDNTKLYFKIEHDKVGELVSNSSVLVIPRPSINITEYAYPSKLPEDLITGIPTITTRVGPTDELLSKADCCLIAEIDDITASLEKVLIRVQAMSEPERRALGQRAIKFVQENLAWDVLGQPLNNVLERV